MSDDPDHTDDLPTLRERARELRAELAAVRARIAEIEDITSAEALTGNLFAEQAEEHQGHPNAHVEGEDVPEGGDVVDA
jgi:hypothetical protein